MLPKACPKQSLAAGTDSSSFKGGDKEAHFALEQISLWHRYSSVDDTPPALEGSAAISMLNGKTERHEGWSLGKLMQKPDPLDRNVPLLLGWKQSESWGLWRNLCFPGKADV